MKALAHYDRLIAIVGTAVLTVGYVWGVLRPGQLAATQVQAETTKIQSQLATLPMQFAEREQMQSQLDGRREQALEFASLVPVEANVSEVLHEVADLARRSQLTITRLEPLPHNDFASYSSLPFSLGCKGDFARVTKFLSGLETQPRLVTFGEVTLTRAADSRDRLVQANVSFNVYSRHAKSASVTENTISLATPSSDN